MADTRTTTQPIFALANDHHIESLIEMMREFYAHEHTPFDEVIARAGLHQIIHDERFGWVHLIHLADDLIGYIVITIGFSLEFHGRYALLDEFYICEEHRRKGIGKLALEFAAQLCRQHDVQAIRLEVDYANADAQRLYRTLGFTEHDRYLMTKWIASP